MGSTCTCKRWQRLRTFQWSNEIQNIYHQRFFCPFIWGMEFNFFAMGPSNTHTARVWLIYMVRNGCKKSRAISSEKRWAGDEIVGTRVPGPRQFPTLLFSLYIHKDIKRQTLLMTLCATNTVYTQDCLKECSGCWLFFLQLPYIQKKISH